MSFRQDEREYFRDVRMRGDPGDTLFDDDGMPLVYGPPENEYGLWREDQLDVLLTKCTVNPFVPLGEKFCI